MTRRIYILSNGLKFFYFKLDRESNDIFDVGSNSGNIEILFSTFLSFIRIRITKLVRAKTSLIFRY